MLLGTGCLLKAAPSVLADSDSEHEVDTVRQAPQKAPFDGGDAIAEPPAPVVLAPEGKDLHPLGRACASGAPEAVLTCLRKGCPARATAVVSPSLEQLGWQLVVCEQKPPQGDDDSPKGSALLYRTTSAGWTFVKNLAEIGRTSKYYNHANFTVLRAISIEDQGHALLRLDWQLDERTCGGGLGGCVSSRSSHATFCLSQSQAPRCTVTVPTHLRATFVPAGQVDNPVAGTASLDYALKVARGRVWLQLVRIKGQELPIGLDARDPGEYLLW